MMRTIFWELCCNEILLSFFITGCVKEKIWWVYRVIRWIFSENDNRAV